MDRTVPTSGNNDINLYIRTYYSLLRSSREVPIRSLIEAHTRVRSALHVGSSNLEPDVSALVYSLLRLPDVLADDINLVLLGQSEWVFAQHGYPGVEAWQAVNAPARRRRSYWDGNRTLALFIASRSDIDDIIPKLTAYQIELDKLHLLLHKPEINAYLNTKVLARDGKFLPEEVDRISGFAGIDPDILTRIQSIWQGKTVERIRRIAQKNCAVSVRLLAGSFVEYKRATRRWWEQIREDCPHIPFYDRPIYFVSSNTHSLPNLLSGHAQDIEQELGDFIRQGDDPLLKQEYDDILKQNVPSSLDNFLYYSLKKYETAHRSSRNDRLQKEKQVGIHRIPSQHVFDLEAQVIELSKLAPDCLDHRLGVTPGDKHGEVLAKTDALIINIDYPLGMAAYQILSEIGRNIAEIRGIFIMGKAATLNGRVGDVMIPSVVHDEHSDNTYLFNNCFSALDVEPYIVYGTVLDNQKAITAPGTFLQNHEYMSVFYNEGYTDLEMEAGPYLSCIYEIVRPKRYPQNEIVTLHHAPFPIGILHYASDTPFSKGINLGSKNLSYEGMDPTYATMIAIFKAILKEEFKRAS